MAADFPSLVSLACHDLRTPLATVQGFAKTMLRTDELDEEKRSRYLGLIDAASDELVVLLDLLSLAARVEDGRYDPVLREVDSLELAPEGASGTGSTVNLDPEAVASALSSLARAAARHGGVDVSTSVDGPQRLDRAGRRRGGPGRARRAAEGSGRCRRRSGASRARRRGHARGRAPDRHAAYLSRGDLSLSIATTPSAGPAARNANAQPQPAASTRYGISQIVATVSVKPTASCSVNAVPT